MRLFAAFGPAQRRQFWQATGIDIGKQRVNEEMFGAFKANVADYREYLAKSSNQVAHEPVKARSDCACDACGSTDTNVVYVTVPKCGRLCANCIDELIRDADSIA